MILLIFINRFVKKIYEINFWKLNFPELFQLTKA